MKHLALVAAFVAAFVALAACGKHEETETSGAGDETARIDLASRTAKRYAFEAYPQWAAAHPDQQCPAKLDELGEYVAEPSTVDPWGTGYRWFCGANLPPGKRGFHVVSAGPDKAFVTADDIQTWQ